MDKSIDTTNEIFVTQDGSHSITAAQFGVSYHSKYGAITESRHVFLQAGLFPLLQHNTSSISILEIGFGTGLNALLTFSELAKRSISVYYEAIESTPISLTQAEALNYPELIDPNNLLRPVFQHLHEGGWGTTLPISAQFSLLKRLGKLEDLQIGSEFNLIYFDAFAPTSQPELWSEEVMLKMYQALKPGGVLVTYCAKGDFKRTLRQVGFEVDRLPGPPGKREMTKATKGRA